MQNKNNKIKSFKNMPFLKGKKENKRGLKIL